MRIMTLGRVALAAILVPAVAAGILVMYVESKFTVTKQELASLHSDVLTAQLNISRLSTELEVLKLSASEMKTTWYGEHWQGKTMANGRPFNRHDFTAAHRTLPMGTKLMLRHGTKSVVVRVTDRGPAAWTGNDLDITERAALQLNMINVGVATLAVVRLN